MTPYLKNIFQPNALGCFIIGASILACDMCVADTKISPVSGESVAGFAIHNPNPKLPPDSVQRNDLRNESLNAWNRYEIVSDTSIRVFFSTGTKSCYGNRAVLMETPQEIRIAVIEGKMTFGNKGTKVG